MIIKDIEYSKRFCKDLNKLPEQIIKIALKKELLFKCNPLHPSLRCHQLKGRLKGVWSLSVTDNYRIIFDRSLNGDIIFLSIGKHDIYKSL